MKFLFDILPIALFFIVYKSHGIYAATFTAIAVSLIQIAYTWFKHHKVEKSHAVSAIMITVLGGLTIALHDKSFILWKPTIVSWVIAGVLLIQLIWRRQSMMQKLMGDKLELPNAMWLKLDSFWITSFLLIGCLNVPFAMSYLNAERALRTQYPNVTDSELVNWSCAETFPANAQSLCVDARDKEQLWVNVKLFGSLGITLLMGIAMFWYMSRHLSETDLKRLSDPSTSSKKDAE
ncbi:MAG: septation protein IspZ [Gammaproteobacteria bacterium]|nr:septation protein IspZ [Gammaproteobacteria bacterium]